jgi:hypothetical protein
VKKVALVTKDEKVKHRNDHVDTRKSKANYHNKSIQCIKGGQSKSPRRSKVENGN